MDKHEIIKGNVSVFQISNESSAEVVHQTMYRSTIVLNHDGMIKLIDTYVPSQIAHIESSLIW